MWIWFISCAGEIRFSGTQKLVLLKASSGKRCAPRKFVLLGMYKCSPDCVLCRARNEIEYEKINVETNSPKAVSTRTSLTWRR